MGKQRKNIRKVPSQLRVRLDEIGGVCVAGCALMLPLDNIKQGRYEHLQIVWSDNRASFSANVEPPASSGRSSRVNCEGKTIVRPDLPKIPKTWSAESPNFGDATTYGTHTSFFTRQVYQREFQPPKHLTIKVKLIGEDLVSGQYAFAFAVNQSLDPTASSYEQDLLFALNLLQENVGSINILRPDADDQEYMATIRNVAWEILPPGEGEARLGQIISGVIATDPHKRDAIKMRVDFLKSLAPIGWIYGRDSLEGYVGAQITREIVVFDNYMYGNAVYVMFKNWETLSQKSRRELLKSYGEEYVRIPHTGNWMQQVLDSVAPYKN